MQLGVVEGTTGPLEFQLLADGAAVNLADCTVTVVLRDKDGVTVTATGTVSVTDAATGKIQYLPAATDLVETKSPYRIRFKVRDAWDRDVFFPSDEPGRLTVRKA